MNILEAAIRRILIRNTDKIITTTVRNQAIDLTDYKPRFPSVFKLIWKVGLFLLIITPPVITGVKSSALGLNYVILTIGCSGPYL